MENLIEQREVERISLEVPIRLGEYSGTTRDISGNGIYFYTNDTFTLDQSIQFSLELDYVVPGKLLQLDCHGQVVRIEYHNGQYGVAAKIDRYCCLH